MKLINIFSSKYISMMIIIILFYKCESSKRNDNNNVKIKSYDKNLSSYQTINDSKSIFTYLAKLISSESLSIQVSL